MPTVRRTALRLAALRVAALRVAALRVAALRPAALRPGPLRLAPLRPAALLLAPLFLAPLLLAPLLLAASAWASPAVAQEADTVPGWRIRMEAHRQDGIGIQLERADLEATGLRTVGAVVDDLVRGGFRDRYGDRCDPAVYWNGLELGGWHASEPNVARTPVSRVDAMEIYFADRAGGLPSEYVKHRCGVVALWIDRANPGSRTALGQAMLLLVVAVAAFLLVGR